MTETRNLASLPNIVRQRWLHPDIAIERVIDFERFGHSHLVLACYAALVSLLTPELVNLIRINFLNEAPWVAEIDLLLSRLCLPRGDGFYEVEPRVREVLLIELKHIRSQKEILHIAQFLHAYLKKKQGQLPTDRYLMYNRIADAYLRPNDMIREASAFVAQNLPRDANDLANIANQIQIIDTMELLREPLQRATRLEDMHDLYDSTHILAYYLYGNGQELRPYLQPPTTSEIATPLLGSVIDWLISIDAPIDEATTHQDTEAITRQVSAFQPDKSTTILLENSKDEPVKSTPQERIEEARKIKDQEIRLLTFIGLLPDLSYALQVEAIAEVIHEVLAIVQHMDNNEDYIRTCLQYLADLPEELKTEIIQAILQAIRWIKKDEVRVEILDALLQSLPETWTNKTAQVEVLDALLQYLPEAWKIEVIRQTLTTATLNIEDEELRIQILSTLLQHSPEDLRLEIEQALRPIKTTQVDSDNSLNEQQSTMSKYPTSPLPQLPSKYPASPLPQVPSTNLPTKSTTSTSSLFTDIIRSTTDTLRSANRRRSLSAKRYCICPSCFSEIDLAKCRILSGKTSGKVLDPPTRGMFSIFNEVPPLDGPYYTLELAHRECPLCRYLLPSNIERVPSIRFAIIGDVLSGQSHYIAALIHQIKTEWLNNANGFARLTCLTPDIEKRYIQDLFEPLFTQQTLLHPTQVATSQYAQPLIYELVVNSSAKSQAMTANLMFYNTAGEDFEDEHRVVDYARIALYPSAFIFIADPFIMQPFISSLPSHIQSSIRGRKAAERLNSTISLYERGVEKSPGGSLPDLPIAVMVSKSDMFKSLYGPNHYTFMTNPNYGNGIDLKDIDTVDREVREILTLHHQEDLLAATRRFQQVKFFATSSTGEPPDAQGHFAHVEPCRCLDPVLWILYQLGIIQENG